MKRRRDKGLGICISTDMLGMPVGSSATPTLPPVMVKHRHDEGLGKCVSKDASALPNYAVPSTTYRCLPSGKMTLKTTVLGLTLPLKPVSAENTPSISQVGPAEEQSELNDLNPSSEGNTRKRTRVSWSYIECVLMTEVSCQYDSALVWLSHRDEFLEEFLRLEGRGDYIDEMCAICLKESGVYRCQSCMGKQLLCRGCVVQTHLFNPLHVIEVCR